MILNLGISHLNLHYNIYLGFHILFAKLNMNCTYLFYFLWFLVSNPWVNLDQSGSSSNLSQECQLADIVHIVILSISQFVAIKLIVNSKWNGIVEVLWCLTSFFNNLCQEGISRCAPVWSFFYYYFLGHDMRCFTALELNCRFSLMYVHCLVSRFWYVYAWHWLIYPSRVCDRLIW